MQKTAITSKYSFSAGHRIPNHDGKCRHPHGHTYTAEVTVAGDLYAIGSGPQEGMVADFSRIKATIGQWIEDNWDHAMIIWQHDAELQKAYAGTPWRKFISPVVPTAEGMAQHLYVVGNKLLKAHFTENKSLSVLRIVIHETEKNSAQYPA